METIIVDGTFQHQKLGGAEDMIVVFVSNIMSPNTKFFKIIFEILKTYDNLLS